MIPVDCLAAHHADTDSAKMAGITSVLYNDKAKVTTKNAAYYFILITLIFSSVIRPH